MDSHLCSSAARDARQLRPRLRRPRSRLHRAGGCREARQTSLLQPADQTRGAGIHDGHLLPHLKTGPPCRPSRNAVWTVADNRGPSVWTKRRSIYVTPWVGAPNAKRYALIARLRARRPWCSWTFAWRDGRIAVALASAATLGRRRKTLALRAHGITSSSTAASSLMSPDTTHHLRSPRRVHLSSGTFRMYFYELVTPAPSSPP